MSRTFLVTILIGAALAAAPAPAALAAPEFVNGLALPGDCSTRAGHRGEHRPRRVLLRHLLRPQAEASGGACRTAAPAAARSTTRRASSASRSTSTRAPAPSASSRSSRPSVFKDELGQPLNGIAPNPTSVLGNSFDPEGFVVHPKTGNISWSPTSTARRCYEFDRNGDPGADLHDSGQPRPAQRRHGHAQLRRRRRATPRASAPTAASKGWPSAPTATSPTPCCRAPCSTRAAATARATASSSSTPRPAPQSPSTPTRWRARPRAAASPPSWPSTITSSSCSSATTAASASARSSSPPNKKVYKIDITGATDVSDIESRAPARCLAGKVTKARPLPRPRRQHAAPRSAAGCRRSGRASPSARS